MSNESRAKDMLMDRDRRMSETTANAEKNVRAARERKAQELAERTAVARQRAMERTAQDAIEKEEKRMRAGEKLTEIRATTFEREWKDPARRSWLAAGGTEAEFDAQWPQMRTELLREASRARDLESRRKHAAIFRSKVNGF